MTAGQFLGGLKALKTFGFYKSYISSTTSSYHQNLKQAMRTKQFCDAVEQSRTCPRPSPLRQKNTIYRSGRGEGGGGGVNAFYKPTTREIFFEKKDPVSDMQKTGWTNYFSCLVWKRVSCMDAIRGEAASNHVSVY